MNSYDDIIDVEYPFKTVRPRMSLYERASQFAPFAALTGYDDLVGETARENEEKFTSSEICSGNGQNLQDN